MQMSWCLVLIVGAPITSRGKQSTSIPHHYICLHPPHLLFSCMQQASPLKSLILLYPHVLGSLLKSKICFRLGLKKKKKKITNLQMIKICSQVYQGTNEKRRPESLMVCYAVRQLNLQIMFKRCSGSYSLTWSKYCRGSWN